MVDPSQQSLSPTTTAQEDATTAGQRRVNLIWEVTQALIAITVTVSMIVSALIQIRSPELIDAFFLIVGFYFSRTNHSAIGGVGPKPNTDQPYRGR